MVPLCLNHLSQLPKIWHVSSQWPWATICQISAICDSFSLGFDQKIWQKMVKKHQNMFFLAIYAYIVLAGTSKFAWMFLVVRCTYAENLKWLPLLFLELFNFEFFQNFKIAYFSYKTWIFGHNVDPFMPNLTIIILVTYIWSTNFFKVMAWGNHPKKWLQMWKKSTKNDKF